MKTALTIAGSDSSGGAGIQADLKTMTMNGVYAMSVITALTAQNTVRVAKVVNVDPEFLALQLDTVIEDIYPDAVKIGMIPTAEAMVVIGNKIREYSLSNIVLDPVMVSSSGTALISENARQELEATLFPVVDLLTPNIPEAETLTGMRIFSELDMEQAGVLMHRWYHCDILLKGGHSSDAASDVLVTNDGIRWMRGIRIDNPNTHGTGCTLSSAIAANLAKGMEMEEAVEEAKDYLTGAIMSGLDLGAGSGPLDHGWKINKN